MAIDIALIVVEVFFLAMVSPWVSRPARSPRFLDRSPSGASINAVIAAILGLAAIAYGPVALIS